MNHLFVTGNLGADPKLAFSQDQKAIASFSIAVGQRVKVNGEWTDGEPMWFQAKFFGIAAEKVMDRYKKGDTVTLSGKLEETHYTTKEGEKRTSKDIIVFDSHKVERFVKGFNDTPAAVTGEAPF